MGGSDGRDTAAVIRQLIGELDTTPLGARLRDPDFRRRHAAEALLRNPDPVMREIGRQVRDGSMNLRDVLKSEAYVNAFREASKQAQQQLDPKRLVAELSGTLALARAERQQGGAARPRGRDAPAREDS